MKFKEIVSRIKDIPHMSESQGKIIYDFILEHEVYNILELGFAHGTSSCYMAAALDEKKKGKLITIDLQGAMQRKPTILQLLDRTGLSHYVQCIFADTSYNWELLKLIESHTQYGLCKPIFDFCFIDGAHTWLDDGFAFFLADKLLLPNGWVLFDDLVWSFDSSPSLSDKSWVQALPLEQRRMKQVQKVFDLLVCQHPSYEDVRIENGWGWARKSDFGVLGRTRVKER